MPLSVIVAAYNAQEYLEEVLSAVKKAMDNESELIVVDDGSDDKTGQIAARFTAKLITFSQNRGRSDARNAAAEASSKDIYVFIDSDIIIQPDTLRKISTYFDTHSQTAAVTGLLAKKHPNSDFFSQYKNLYMHYTFGKLPDHVSFLYGAISAVRREAFLPFDRGMHAGEDTALGQKLYLKGRRIDFVRTLEVIHLKRYTCRSFFWNDFCIPRSWAKIFLRFGGLRQLGYKGTGFAHASFGQLISVVTVPLVVLMLLLGNKAPGGAYIVLTGLVAWSIVNAGFLGFLLSEKGVRFTSLAVIITVFDHIVMAAGIISGTAACLLERK